MSGTSNGASVDPTLKRLAMQWAGELFSESPNAEQTKAQLLAAMAGPSAALEIVTGSELFATLAPIDWVCQGLEMAPGAPSIWAGYGFSGKTYAAQALALAVASGRDVWGSFGCRRGKVLHLDFEQGRRLTLSRYQKLARGIGVGPDEIGDRLGVAPFPRLSLASAGAENTLRQACEGVSLLIVDSYRAACPEVDENASEARRPLDMLTRISEATGCTVLVIHHSRKPFRDSQGGAKMAMRGSSGLFDAAASVLVFEGRERGKPSTVTHQKARLSGRLLDEFGLEIRDVLDVDGRFDGVEVVTTSAPSAGTDPQSERARAQSDRIKAAILDALNAHPDGLSARAIRETVGGYKDRVDGALDLLIAERRVNVTPGPRNSRIHRLAREGVGHES